MHKFMRAIGLAGLQGRGALEKLLTYCVQNADERNYLKNEDEEIWAEFRKEFAPGLGVVICGEFKENNHFTYEYYYPYIKGTGISSKHDVTVERHAATESYAGVCDDPRLGISMIFYLQNMIPYLKNTEGGQTPVRNTTVTVSALSLQGSIMFPIAKTQSQVRTLKKRQKYRTRLINSAKNGDENAIESLTLDDMDIYTTISNKIHREDVYTLVDNYFMPYGVECDLYSILGEITDYHLVINQYTKEIVYILSIDCNNIKFDLCINRKDLLGEPSIGRRFKGNIWMQGFINYPEDMTTEDTSKNKK